MAITKRTNVFVLNWYSPPHETAYKNREMITLVKKDRELAHRFKDQGERTGCIEVRTGCIGVTTGCIGVRTGCIGERTGCIELRTGCIGVRAGCMVKSC